MKRLNVDLDRTQFDAIDQIAYEFKLAKNQLVRDIVDDFLKDLFGEKDFRTTREDINKRVLERISGPAFKRDISRGRSLKNGRGY